MGPRCGQMETMRHSGQDLARVSGSGDFLTRKELVSPQFLTCLIPDVYGLSRLEAPGPVCLILPQSSSGECSGIDRPSFEKCSGISLCPDFHSSLASPFARFTRPRVRAVNLVLGYTETLGPLEQLTSEYASSDPRL